MALVALSGKQIDINVNDMVPNGTASVIWEAEASPKLIIFTFNTLGIWRNSTYVKYPKVFQFSMIYDLQSLQLHIFQHFLGQLSSNFSVKIFLHAIFSLKLGPHYRNMHCIYTFTLPRLTQHFPENYQCNKDQRYSPANRQLHEFSRTWRYRTSILV